MSTRHAAHQRFLAFVTAFYRANKCDLQYFDSDADSPIAFDVEVHGVTLTVGYDPAAGDAVLFVHCVFGTVPAHEEISVLRRLLQLNLALARDHNATYCIDTGTQAVSYYLRRSTVEIDVAAFRERLSGIALQALQWRQTHFLGDTSGSGGQANSPPSGRGSPDELAPSACGSSSIETVQ